MIDGEKRAGNHNFEAFYLIHLLCGESLSNAENNHYHFYTLSHFAVQAGYF
jgi:hypothetical protein